MGVMRFLVHPRDQLDAWPERYSAYISGPEGRVFPTRVEFADNILSCRRQFSDSGRLNVAWPVPGFGCPVMATSSLSEREAPYVLAVELARGKIAQVRDQAGMWEIAGMSIPDEFHVFNRTAHQLFAKAASIQHVPDQASALAIEALAKAMQAAEIITRSYASQRLNVRRRRSNQLPASLGCQLGAETPSAALETHFCTSFGAAAVPVAWRQIEPVEGEYAWDGFDAQVAWCERQKLLAFGGPLLDLSAEGLPEWLWQWEKDFFNLLSFVSDFVETAISRYAGRIRHWEVAARVNTGGALALSEENRLNLTARALEVARQVDDEVQLQLRIDQPWGEYLARGQHRLSPLQFVDALLRSGVGLSALNLEINVGYKPAGSPSRDLLDFSQLVDHWSCLGLPLYVTLAFPSDTGSDPLAQRDLEVDESVWKSAWSAAAQAEWVEMYLPLLLAKQSVVGIFWTHFSDADPHRYPHAGVIDRHGNPKPALKTFAKFSRASAKLNHS